MLDGFPSYKKTNGIVAISLYSRKVLVGLVQGKRTPDETDMVAVQKALADVRRDARRRGLLCVPADVESP